jgi:hypothetical protein
MRTFKQKAFKEVLAYWWLSIFVVSIAWLAVLTFANQAFDQAILPDEVTGVDTVKVMAPASPGLASAEEACRLGKVSRIQILNGGQQDWKYFAQYGLVTVEWPDSPPGKNFVGIVDGQPVVLSLEVMKCFKNHF